MPPGSRQPGRARNKVAAGAPCRARTPARKGRDGESHRIVPRAVGSAPFYQQSMSVGVVQYHTDTTGGSGAHNDHLSPRYHSRRWRCDRSQGTAGLSPFGRIFCCPTNISMPTRGSGSGRRTRPVGPGFSRTSSPPPPQGHSGILKPTVGGRTRGHTRAAGAAGRVEGQLKAQGAEYLRVRYYNSPEILQFTNAVSRESHDVVDCLLRLGTELVIRIDIRGADDAPSVDDEASRHRQGPAALAVAHCEIIAKAEIDRLEVVGKFEPQTQLGGVIIAGIGQEIEGDPLLFNQRTTGFRQLRRDRDERRALFLQGARYLLQSIQLCDAVGSPATAENGQDQRAFCQQVGRPHFPAKGVF